MPIMIMKKYGKGIVFYTSFHNHAQSSEKEKSSNIKSIYYKKVARKMKVRFTAEIIDDNSSFQVLENLNTTD